jgi:hypothetical protein
MKLKFDFDSQSLPMLVGKAIVEVSFGFYPEDREQFINIQLDDGSELHISARHVVPETIEFDLCLPSEKSRQGLTTT